MKDYKLYIIKITDDDETTTEYEKASIEHAKEIIDTLKNSTFAPKTIKLYGYRQGKKYLIQL